MELRKGCLVLGPALVNLRFKCRESWSSEDDSLSSARFCPALVDLQLARAHIRNPALVNLQLAYNFTVGGMCCWNRRRGSGQLSLELRRYSFAFCPASVNLHVEGTHINHPDALLLSTCILHEHTSVTLPFSICTLQRAGGSDVNANPRKAIFHLRICENAKNCPHFSMTP